VVTIDPSRAASEELEYLLLLAEAHGTGRIFLRDGSVLSGRIVSEGIDFEPGATIYIAGDTEIIALGDTDLTARFEPLPWADENVDADDQEDAAPLVDAFAEPFWQDAPSEGVPSDIADLDPPALALAQGAPGAPIQPTCSVLASATAKRGKKPPKVSFSFSGTLNYAGLPAANCAGALAIQNPDPLNQVVLGTRSARAVGGRGGHGFDVSIRGVGNSTININGPVCNGAGGPGGSATAIGVDGPPCECGGDALARGGRGGDAGRLHLTARNINWNMAAASITLQPGGAGGAASAVAGDGGDCNLCGGQGGRGGHASAIGGEAGRNGRIFIAASNVMVPAPQVVLVSAIFSATPSADGGAASAEAGLGGDGGDCVNCNDTGGPGGPGGDAFARGSDGAHGVLLAASVGGAIKAYLGTDGGAGGEGEASAGGAGGGGDGASCPCSAPLQAGHGGPGGAGGSATARGGKGGDARGGKAALALVFPLAGFGGDATALCGNGGDGGNGGSCVKDTPELCTPGGGGPGGAGGVKKASGGKAGKALDNAALAGADGVADPAPGDPANCPNGVDGDPGLIDCPPPPDDDCCQPGVVPGCNDPGCQGTVCPIDPFCCRVLWDAICADLANQLCPICNGTSLCCVPGPQAGCGSPACEGVVCQTDPFCCEVAWDGLCVEKALALCVECGAAPASCCVPHPSPGCSSNACMATVCEFLPHCCQFQWDLGCVSVAEQYCPECAPAQ
jgi:hypothetical protein